MKINPTLASMTQKKIVYYRQSKFVIEEVFTSGILVFN